MHAVLKKHANAVDTYGSEFADELEAGESLTGTPTLTVTTIGPIRVDKTTEFVSGAVSIGGTQVIATFKARAGAGQQANGVYEVRVVCGTNANRTLVDTWELYVHEEGVPAA